MVVRNTQNPIRSLFSTKREGRVARKEEVSSQCQPRCSDTTKHRKRMECSSFFISCLPRAPPSLASRDTGTLFRTPVSRHQYSLWLPRVVPRGLTWTSESFFLESLLNRQKVGRRFHGESRFAAQQREIDRRPSSLFFVATKQPTPKQRRESGRTKK